MDQVSLVKYNISASALVTYLDGIFGRNKYGWKPIKVGASTMYEVTAARKLSVSEHGEIKQRSGVTLVDAW
ncbi:hypothetical protein AYL99_11408 [Fonsecaea erecta]|uniref:Uncharacterized protein n=1 Tax=Fonsecaea erecta TaxID=1367422 RepID=A0A178Z3I6_9EURO|nr:hypothetical protein AYL99_11408 [Fonsecaea erecta]OAP54307.1 hypothetical protein AYL99_11408 [Fonsecaea erecta]